MSSVIRVSNLSKSFGDISAVNNLSFTVTAGEVYGFLGQNGAGKSTTIRMLLTLLKPDNGEIEIFGMKLYEHRKEILRKTGAIIEKPDLYKYLSAYDNLRIFGIISGAKLSSKDIIAQLNYVGLAERAHHKVRTFSQGMKQRLGLAIALVNNPDLIILDEPINGLDPQGIADVRNLIIHLSRNEKKTILISSHLLNEMELIADSLLIIDKGEKIVEGPMQELIHPEKLKVELISTNREEAVNYIQSSSWKNSFVDVTNDIISLEMKKELIPQFNSDLVKNNILVNSLRPVHTLEDYFLYKTQH
ncbi:MAG: ABC transporter ATP-binding protein [Bacteroidetes bacterium]|nr:MAG: ABC transporter ATP-binding protein [Bacteroidota bacterium]